MSHTPIDLIKLPVDAVTPLRAVLRRVGIAIFLLLFIAAIVLVGRDGYTDSAGGSIGVLDALYYSSVTVTTTGYGDISAVTPAARLGALLLIMPARILFLILVVGTTVEVLTERSRTLMLTKSWRKNVKNHHIICGYGSLGQSAVDALLNRGVRAKDIVVVDEDPAAIKRAAQEGFITVLGSATRMAVLHQAGIDSAGTVIVTPDRDDTAALITLTVRELSESVNIVVAGHEQENLHLLRQSGADSVIDSSAAVGRLLGLASQTPGALDLVGDLLESGSDLELAELRPVASSDGTVGAPAGVQVVGVIRDGQRLPFDHPGVGNLQGTDVLIVVRNAIELV